MTLSEGGMSYEEIRLISPGTGDIWWCAEETLKLAESDPENQYALYFNGHVLRIGPYSTRESVAKEYWDRVNRKSLRRQDPL